MFPAFLSLFSCSAVSDALPPMDCSPPGSSALCCPPEFAHAHIHRVDATTPSGRLPLLLLRHRHLHPPPPWLILHSPRLQPPPNKPSALAAWGLGAACPHPPPGQELTATRSCGDFEIYIPASCLTTAPPTPASFPETPWSFHVQRTFTRLSKLSGNSVAPQGASWHLLQLSLNYRDNFNFTIIRNINCSSGLLKLMEF